MVGYVIPLRPRARTADWEMTCILLGQTVRSILAAEDPGLRIFLVTHDHEALPPFTDPRVEIVPATLPLPKPDELKSGQNDRNRKVILGCQRVLDEGIAWTFVCDADDLVSRQLNGIIRREHRAEACVVRTGYEVHAGWHRAYLRRNLHRICGSTFAVRTRHIFPDAPDRLRKGLFLFHNHSTLEGYLAEKGLPLATPSEPLVAYLRHHGGNVSDVWRSPNVTSRLSEWVKFRLLGCAFRGARAEAFAYRGE